MKKYRLLFFLLLPILGYSDTNNTLESYQTRWTHYYHSLLSLVDNTVACKTNCKHKERQTIKHNSLRLITSIKSTKNNRFKLSLNLRAHIHLPKLSDKLEITFSQQTVDNLTNKHIDFENENTITDNKLRVGLRYYFKRSTDFNFYTRLGFKIRSPFGIYQELTAQKVHTLHKDLKLEIEGNLYYYINHTYLAKSARISFYKPLNSIYRLEQTNEIYTNHDNEHTKHIQSYLKLYHRYDKKNQFAYWVTYAMIDDQTSGFIKDWQGISLSHIHHLKKWLYINTIPRILQRRENGFENEFVLTLSLGIMLGPKGKF